MNRTADTDFPIHDLVAARWSPVGFDARPVPVAELCSLFEAARWSASSFNEQPWSFLLATRDDTDAFERVLSCLVEANQDWAKNVPVLALTCTCHRFQHNDKLNTAALHDLGLAVAGLTFEATARNLFVHSMKGILPDRARELFEVPDNVEVVAAIALGYLADLATLPEQLRKRDQSPRTRKRLSGFVFGSRWGLASGLVEERSSGFSGS